jgi:hypothetical protein
MKGGFDSVRTDYAIISARTSLQFNAGMGFDISPRTMPMPEAARQLACDRTWKEASSHFAR